MLESLRFDPPEIRDGAAATLVIQVTDDLSGVKTVSGSVRSPSGAATLFFQGQGEVGGSSFAGRIAIPSKAETGSWYVASLSVIDRAGNPLVANFTAGTGFPGSALRVVSEESDSTPPEVRRVFLEKGAVGGGEKNVIRIDVADDRSGVATITGAFQSASRSANLPFSCRAGTEPDVWVGEVQVPSSAECGEWTLRHVRAVDAAGNVALLVDGSPQLARVAFTVSSAECDSAAPTLESFRLTPDVVSNATATEVLVTAEVRDDDSGASSMSGWFRGPVSTNGQFPKIFFSCARAPNAPDALWTGKIVVPQHAARGTWKVGLVRLQDKARNIRDYIESDPVLAESSFEVQ